MNEAKLLYHLDQLIFKDIRTRCQDVTQYAIAGGCIRALMCGDEVKDYDVFCSSRLAEMDLIKFFKDRIHEEENRGPNPQFKELQSNDRLANFIYNGKWFQVIRNKYFNFNWSTELIDRFDFTICQAMVCSAAKFTKAKTNDPKETDLYLKTGQYFYQDNLSKHLRINKIEFPYSTLERMQKYAQKGYTACRKTLIDIGDAIRTMNRDGVAFAHGALANTFYGLD